MSVLSWLRLAFIGCLVFGFSAEGDAASQKKIKAVTTFTVIADIARNVAEDAAIVESITKPGAEIHDYQPTPKDIVRAQNADVIFWNGLNLERWFEKFLSDVENVPDVVVSKGVEPLSIYEGPYSGKPNPHAWMSANNVLIYVENIRQALVDLDPDQAAIYNANAARYREEIKTRRDALKSMLAFVPSEHRALVTSEGAFSYLAKEIGFEEVYLWPMNADQQGSPQQVRRVIDMVRARGIPVVFSESTISDKPARQVARETGATYGGVLYVDSLSAANGPVPTYLDLLSMTMRTIANGFNEAITERQDNE